MLCQPVITIKLLRSISLILSLAIAFQITSNAIYKHTHILNDGSIVTHAHPYDRSTDNKPFKKHTHTSPEISFLNELETLSGPLFTGITILCFSSNLKLPVFQAVFILSTFRAYLPGRSPPATVSDMITGREYLTLRQSTILLLQQTRAITTAPWLILKSNHLTL